MSAPIKLWPIAVGLTLWSGAGYLAYTGTWWPLWIVAAVSVLPGLFALVSVLLMRAAGKTIGDGVAKVADAAAEAGPTKRPRTNARTAGRRKGAASGVLLCALGLGSEGCQRILEARDQRIAAERGSEANDVPAKAGTSTAPAPVSPAPIAPMRREDPALSAVLERAIVPPVGDGTYLVDPFVAALVYERIRAGQGPTLTPVAAANGGPAGGYRVSAIEPGSLWSRLGLVDGDVVESINGVVLTGPDRVGFALDGAQNRVDVSVFRDDLSFVNRYRLEQAVAWPALLARVDPGSSEVGAATIESPSTTTPVETPSPAIATGTTKPSSTPSSPPRDTPRPSTPGGGGTTPRPTPGTTTPPTAAGPVACESTSRCTIERSYFDKLVASPSSIESQANIVPAIANDVFSGYKLKSVKAGSAIAKLGFHAGDKITHINGQDLTDEVGAMGLYLGLASTKVFKIRYERGGARLVKTVVVD